jgi:Sec-independent protein secretion pathway component TatC
MWFSVGMIEVGIVGVLALVTGVLAVLRLPAWRWTMIGAVCAVVAMVSTPADAASTLLLTALFFIFFLGGSRFGRWQTVAVA